MLLMAQGSQFSLDSEISCICGKRWAFLPFAKHGWEIYNEQPYERQK